MEINPRWFVNFNTCLLHFNQKCCHDTAYLTARPIARCCRMTCLTLYGHIKTAEQHNCISSVCFCLFLCLCFSVRFYCLSLCGFSHNSNKLIDWLLVHWALMGGLLHLVQRGGAWVGCGPAQSPPRCTKRNSPPINGQCTNFISFDVALYCLCRLTLKGEWHDYTAIARILWQFHDDRYVTVFPYSCNEGILGTGGVANHLPGCSLPIYPHLVVTAHYSDTTTFVIMSYRTHSGLSLRDPHTSAHDCIPSHDPSACMLGFKYDPHDPSRPRRQL